MHPLRPVVVFLAAGLMFSMPTAAAQATTTPDEEDPSPEGWDWVQASTFPDRYYETLLAAGPRVVAHGTEDDPAVVSLSSPWRDGGDLALELRIHALKDGRWTERWRQELRVPWEEGGAPGAGRSALAAHGDRVLVTVAGGDKGEGKAWLVHSTPTATLIEGHWDAPAEAIGFGRTAAVEGDIAVVAALDTLYVYHEEEGRWSLTQTIVRPPGGRFGTSVALGQGLLLIGAPGAALDGQVEVFQHTDGSFAHVVTVSAPQGVTAFGEAVVTEGLESAALGWAKAGHGSGPMLARIASQASWTADAVWPLGSAPIALDIWNGTVLATAAGELLSTPLSGPPQPLARTFVASELSNTEGFGLDLARSPEWLVVSQAPRTLHFFTAGGTATECPPCLCQADCDPLPVEAGGVRLLPETPTVVRPAPDVEIVYEVTAPATLVQDVHWRPDAPAGVPAAPGNERIPDITWYLDVHVHELVPDGPAPELRVTLRLPYDPARLPGGLEESELSVFFFDGIAWQDLRRVPAGSRVPATTPEGDLTVYSAAADTDNDTVWATVDHTSLYAIGLSSRPLTGAPTPESVLQGPMLWIGVLAFMAGSVWVSNLILSPRRPRTRPVTSHDPHPQVLARSAPRPARTARTSPAAHDRT